MKNKIRILLDLYGTYYPRLIDTLSLIRAFKNLPSDLKLEPKFEKSPLGPPVLVERTIGERIEELKRDEKILTARVDSIKRELEEIPGGTDALKEWKWEVPKIQFPQ